MCVTRALLRSFVLLILLVNSGGKRRCNYTEILATYRELVFVHLQNLNLTAPFNNSKDKSICPSVKAHHILNSIYDTTQWMRCQIGGKPSDLNKTVESMEQIIIVNCSPDYLGETLSCATVKKIKGKKKKRMRLIKKIKALTICWQKLQSVFPVKSS